MCETLNHGSGLTVLKNLAMKNNVLFIMRCLMPWEGAWIFFFFPEDKRKPLKDNWECSGSCFLRNQTDLLEL